MYLGRANHFPSLGGALLVRQGNTLVSCNLPNTKMEKIRREKGIRQFPKSWALYDAEPFPPPPAFSDECSEWIEESLNEKSIPDRTASSG
jgi:hypothetical protein